MQDTQELKPGKKGISLQVKDWEAVCAAEPAISQALQSGNLNYSLQLSGK